MFGKKNYIIYQIIFAYIFVVAGCIISLLQIFIMPFTKINLVQKLNTKLTYMHWSVIVAYSQWVCDLKVNVWAKAGDLEKFRQDNSIVIANHKYQPDWLALWCVGEHINVLQNFKSMAKHSLLYVPVVGWQFWINDFVLVKRKLEHDRNTLQNCVQRYSSIKDGHFWLSVFCEGTRFTRKKHDVSVEYAKKKSMKPLKHHLMPRTRGFTMLANGMREIVPAVFDATICFDSVSDPTLLEFINGKSIVADIMLRRIPMGEIPEDETKSGDFLMDVYYEKDNLCEFHQNHKRFPTSEGENYDDFVKIPVKKSNRAMMVLSFWFTLLVFPLIYILLAYGSLSYVFVTIFAILSTSRAFQKILGSGKPQSTYGQS